MPITKTATLSFKVASHTVCSHGENRGCVTGELLMLDTNGEVLRTSQFVLSAEQVMPAVLAKADGGKSIYENISNALYGLLAANGSIPAAD